MSMIHVGLWVAGLFGKSPSVTAAKRLGAIVVALGLFVAMLLALCYGLRMYTAGKVEQAQQRQNVQAARAERDADRSADAALVNRAEVAEEQNDRLTNAMAEAKQSDPDRGTRHVGPVQQSYFDNLPEKRR